MWAEKMHPGETPLLPHPHSALSWEMWVTLGGVAGHQALISGLRTKPSLCKAISSMPPSLGCLAFFHEREDEGPGGWEGGREDGKDGSRPSWLWEGWPSLPQGRWACGLLRGCPSGAAQPFSGGPSVCRVCAGVRTRALAQECPGRRPKPWPQGLQGGPATCWVSFPQPTSCGPQWPVVNASGGAGEKGRKRCVASWADCFRSSWEKRAEMLPASPATGEGEGDRRSALRQGDTISDRPSRLCGQASCPAFAPRPRSQGHRATQAQMRPFARRRGNRTTWCPMSGPGVGEGHG